MKRARFLFFLFLLVPILEIYLLIRVGSLIGPLPTVALIALTAVLGTWMLRQQGFRTLQRARSTLDEGRIPAQEVLEGVILLIGGALLLTPGFVTDALGFLCLLPRARRWLLGQLTKRFQAVRAPGTRSSASGGRVIEGQWQREEDSLRRNTRDPE